jgi:RNA polymerase sigma-70 factor (ECF subfamily)
MSASRYQHASSARPPAQWFATTHWTVLLNAADSRAPGAREALEKLCRAYWYPLYAFVRRKGHDSHDAQDLTQEFFARLLAQHFLHDVHPDKGKFRSFLLASMNHFLAKEWRRDGALKRGGGSITFSLDAEAAEGHYRLEPAHHLTPEALFERRWAMTLLDEAMAGVREDYRAEGKEQLFNELKTMLSGERTEARYAEIAPRLGMTESALKKAAQRLRERYRDCLRTGIALTVAKPDEIDGEIRYLFGALRA